MGCLPGANRFGRARCGAEQGGRADGYGAADPQRARHTADSATVARVALRTGDQRAPAGRALRRRSAGLLPEVAVARARLSKLLVSSYARAQADEPAGAAPPARRRYRIL